MAGKSGVSMNWGGLDKILEAAPSKLLNKRKALLADIGEAMLTSTKQRFLDEEDPDGKPWKPSKRALARGGKTLTDKANLRKISAATTNDGVIWGSNLPYARIHQKGGMAGRGRKVKIDKRAYLGMNAADQEEVAAIIKDHLEDVFTD